MCELAIYETVCGELLIDPELVCREIDDLVIQMREKLAGQGADSDTGPAA